MLKILFVVLFYIKFGLQNFYPLIRIFSMTVIVQHRLDQMKNHHYFPINYHIKADKFLHLSTFSSRLKIYRLVILFFLRLQSLIIYLGLLSQAYQICIYLYFKVVHKEKHLFTFLKGTGFSDTVQNDSQHILSALTFQGVMNVDGIQKFLNSFIIYYRI